MTASKTPRYDGLAPASPRASAAARGASRKRDTRCEVALRRALWRLGLRYRVDVAALPGRPDIVFRRERVAVFCDGDFWHGRELAARRAKLAAGHNAPYWVAKIESNVARDRRHDEELRAGGWLVLRYWESKVLSAAEETARAILDVVQARRATLGPSGLKRA